MRGGGRYSKWDLEQLLVAAVHGQRALRVLVGVAHTRVGAVLRAARAPRLGNDKRNQ